MRCFASKVWQMILLEIKNSVSIESFKEKIRKWEPSLSAIPTQSRIRQPNLTFITIYGHVN